MKTSTYYDTTANVCSSFVRCHWYAANIGFVGDPASMQCGPLEQLPI